MSQPPDPPRSRAQRREHAFHQLEHEVDAWVASADGTSGTPCLVPLSFWWDGSDGGALLFSTRASNPTGRNLQAYPQVSVAVGRTRDVLLIEGTVVALTAEQISTAEADAFAAKAGFEPRASSGYLYFRVEPQRIKAWREVEELADRDLMREGRWLAD